MAEWLPQITPDTSYQEILERPSAFNPQPELMDGRFEITGTGVLMGRNENMRHAIQYSDGTALDVEWPIYRPVKRDEANTRPLHADDDSKNRWKHLAATEFEEFEQFWEPQAAMLAHQRLSDDGKITYDKIFDHAHRIGVLKDPNTFTTYATKSFEFCLRNELPATAYVIAKTAFNGVIMVQGSVKQCNGLRTWLDEHIMHIIEPRVSQIVSNMHPTQRSAEDAELGDIHQTLAKSAIDLAQCNWVMRSLKKADAYYADSHPELAEKIVWHQIMTGKQSIQAAQNLMSAMNAIPDTKRASTSLRPEGQTPAQLGSYILDILN